MYDLKGKITNREDLYSPWITLQMKFTWLFYEISDKPPRKGISYRSSQWCPKQVGIALRAIVA